MAILHNLRDSSDAVRDVIGQMTSGVGEASLRSVRMWAERAWTLDRGLLWMFIVASGIGAACLILLRWDRWPYGRSAERPAARAQQQIVQLYKKTLELARRRGLRISPSTTPTELAQLVSKQWSDAEPTMIRLTKLYCRGRFGIGPLSGEELRQAVEDIAVLKRLTHRLH
jgi:hypothetical protein